MFSNFFTSKELSYIKLIEQAYMNAVLPLDDSRKQLMIRQENLEYEIKKINTLISPSYFVIQKNSIRLITPENENISNIYAQFLKNNNYFNILEALFFHSGLTTFELSQNLFISVSTLKRKISGLRSILAPFNIEIHTRPLRIVGNEKNIIDLYTSYFLEAYPNRPYPFPEEEISFFLNFYKELHKEWGIKSQITEISHDTTKVLVNLYREKAGFFYEPLPTPQSIKTGLNLKILYSETFIRSFKTIFKLDLTPNIIVRLFSNYLDFPYQFSYQQLLQNRQNKQIGPKIIASETFLDSLSTAYGIPIINKQKLILDMVNYLFELEHRKVPDFILNNGATRFIIENKEIPQTFLEKFQELLSKHLQPVLEKEINRNEIFFRVLINWDRLLYSIILNQPKAKVGVLLNSYTAHSLFLVEQLSLQHSVYADFSPIYFDDSLESLQSYDLVITDISDFECSCEKIVIDRALMDKDWVKIANKIRNIRQKKLK